MARQLLLVSSSQSHPHGYLDHCEAELRSLFAGVREVVFVPYARPAGKTHDEYTAVARDRFQTIGIELRGLHEFAHPPEALARAAGVFIGGGNTFVLLRDLLQFELLDILRRRIADGMPYMGTSAGSNVAGISIGTSNDMPIVAPPTFEAIGAVPFNLNPHFPAAPPDPTHRGETREDRLAEFHVFNVQPVVALHEDGMLRVDGNTITLHGEREALIFRPDQAVQRIRPGQTLPTDLLPG